MRFEQKTEISVRGKCVRRESLFRRTQENCDGGAKLSTGWMESSINEDYSLPVDVFFLMSKKNGIRMNRRCRPSRRSYQMQRFLKTQGKRERNGTKIRKVDMRNLLT